MRFAFSAAVLSLFLFANATFAAGLQDGFRGIKWGTPFSEINDRIFEKTHGVGIMYNADEYTVQNDNLSIGDIPLRYLNYLFDRDTNQFVGVSMMYNHKQDAEMKSSVLKAFGGEQGYESCKEKFKPLHIYLGTCIIVYKLPKENKEKAQPSVSGGTF